MIGYIMKTKRKLKILFKFMRDDCHAFYLEEVLCKNHQEF